MAGNPNAGKTSLFNSLTGLRQKVANYPGVTVESKSGQWIISPDLPPARLIDLPGLYSLNATSLDEKIASDMLVDRGRMDADAIIVVVDATNLVRNLYLAMQLIETRQPIVIALTMFDLAERSNLKIDVEKLSASLGVPVVPVAINGTTWLAIGRTVRIRIGRPIDVSGRPTSETINAITATTRSALLALAEDFGQPSRPGRLGAWLTELFNDWPEGRRPPASTPRSESDPAEPSPAVRNK